MKRAAKLVALSVTALFCSASMSASPISPETVVVGIALTKLEIPERISAVFWTRRKDEFTLQISRRTNQAPRLIPASRSAPATSVPPDWEILQVWLLKGDGTHVPPTRSLRATVPTRKHCTGPARLPTLCWDYEFQHSFSLAEGAEAVAIALRVGDEFLIEKLSAFPQ